jgi:tRNA-specific 2-thiouridylase
VAQILGVDHHVFNYTEEFERLVVDPFVTAHAQGRTPNPCIECNRHIKFDLLVARARRLGFDALATGHHARIIRRGDRAHLARGRDRAKDQSYVLGFLPGSTLSTLVLPVGEMTKDEVRTVAERWGLRTWDKPDSQDVCFIESTAGREGFLTTRLDFTSADIVDVRSGDVVGATATAELMTVGQRRGIMPDRDGERRYVARVDLPARRVVVGRLDDVVVTRVSLQGEPTFAHEPLVTGSRVFVQISAHGRPGGALVVHHDGWHLEFDEPMRPIAPGQSVVFYDHDDPEVVCGAAVVGS